MPYAEVSVNAPAARDRTFSYSIPDGLDIGVGQAVWVPFGLKTLQGIVIELTAVPAFEPTRDILGVIDATPLLTAVQIALAGWLSRYYLAPLFDAVALMLPPAFERRVITFIQTSPGSLPPEGELRPFFELIQSSGKIDQRAIEKQAGILKTRSAIKRLLQASLITRSFELERERVRPKFETYVKLKAFPDEVQSSLQAGWRLPARQASVIKYLMENPVLQPLAELKQKTGASAAAIKALLEAGRLDKMDFRINRDPLEGRIIELTYPLKLTASQETVFRKIRLAVQQPPVPGAKPPVFLLFGVTGSGKTEIYLQALEETVRAGRKGIVLVPEISMTPQIIERFMARFPGRVAVLHSELTLGERFDEWWLIKKGEFDVVIGPRSALFAPLPDTGLIILDEEHEWTYKQEDSPRYHTRQVALKLAELSGAVVILGSATPDVESFQKTRISPERGGYQLLELPERAGAGIKPVLPRIDVVDLREELKAHNLSLFSRALQAAMTSALEQKERIILFLNRRGGATFIECRHCGLVIRCKRCGNTLSYHINEEILLCHRCNYRSAVPLRCPRCRSNQIKYLGVGTEKLEQETAAAFPQARILRWDSDSLKQEGLSHRTIFEKFRAGEADILIGTQMIAKGLDLPEVTLVGVISADVSLNLPDFRAAERTFQLLSQVAGRAGRGASAGRVIIQTYAPQHYAVQFASRHDYLSFFKTELEYRRQLNYPPFSRLARLVFAHNSDQACQAEAERMQQQLITERDSRGIADISLIGPAPAFIHRWRGKYRWQLIVRASDPSAFLAFCKFPRGWGIDIDPVGLT